MALNSGELEVFAAVVSAGSFGRAATALMVSQPSVSERIARLERRLATQLFERTSRGVALTAAGEALVPFAQSQRELLRDAVEAVRATAEVPRLLIAVHSTFTARVAPPVLASLVGLKRRVEFRDAHSDRVISMIVADEADAGFIVASTTPRGMMSHRLPIDPICCVVSPDHDLATLRRCRLRDIDGHPIAYNRWGDGAQTFTDLLARHHHQPDLCRRVADARTAGLLAANHHHVAFVARSAVEPELETKTLQEVEVEDLPDWGIETEFIHRANTSDEALQRIAQALSVEHTSASGRRARVRR